VTTPEHCLVSDKVCEAVVNCKKGIEGFAFLILVETQAEQSELVSNSEEKKVIAVKTNQNFFIH
jgi:hypothetical protein